MKRALLVLSCWIAVVSSAAAQTANGESRSPSLVVVISVDQLRYDYLERFAPWFAERGFNRFLRSGATFPNTHYLHAGTFTGPGHASIGSGKHPFEHGIVGNTWFERDSAVDTKRWQWFFDDSGGYAPPIRSTPDPALPLWFQNGRGSPRYCVYDENVAVNTGTSSGMSPRSLLGEGLGDRVKDRYPSSRVIGIALKDRAAVLMAGHKADAAYWFDQKLPGFISSTYYKFDPDVFAFNTSVPGYIPGSHSWTPSPFIPPADLERVTFDPPEAWPLKNTRYGGTFPHPVNDIRQLVYSPYGNDLTLDFALSTIVTEALGTRSTPDVVFVSLSSTDYFGHYYGPDSMEAADGVVRLDRALERFLDALERRFGDRLTVALTADHGVQSTPDIAKLRDPNIDAGRIDLRNPDRKGQRVIDLPPARLDIERQLAIRLHAPFSPDAAYSKTLVYFFEEPSLYLNLDRLRELKIDPEKARRALRDIVLNIPGVEDAWTDTELRAMKRPSPLEKMMLRSYRPDRSGDVLLALKPNWIWTWGSNSTTHGQPVENDTHVPLLFWGEGVRPGRYSLAAAPTDLARTLGVLLGVEAGGEESKVLPAVETPAAADSAHDAVLQLALRELDPKGTIPRDQIRIDKVSVQGDKANVVLWVGRPPKPKPGEVLLDCGTGHTYNFERRNGRWVLVAQGVMQC